MAQAATLFPEGLYLPFRDFRDPAGLECLDTRCDLWTDYGGPDAYQLSLDAQFIYRGNATNATQPAFGLKVPRAADRFRLTMTKLQSDVGNTGTPVPFQLVVKLGQAGAGEDAQFDKVITVPAYDRTGLLCQLSGLLFDTVQVWLGNDFAGPAGANTQKMVVRAFVDRSGQSLYVDPATGLTHTFVLDGPFKT